jgi:hypothetical protein
MLNKKYLDDAFILHDETYIFDKTNDYILDLSEKKLAKEYEIQNKDSEDARRELSKEWAEFRNIMKFQPLFKVRNYFGEIIALYFAWCGTVISSLWLVSCIGIIFFFIGFANSITFQSNLNKTSNTSSVQKLVITLIH